MPPRARLALAALLAVALPAHAAGADTEFGLIWAGPFAGLLLSIAIVPLFAAHFWHEHFGKVTLAWALALVVPFLLTFGLDDTLRSVAHAMLEEYVPFFAILFALYTIAGGICVRGSFVGTPALNTGVLALGTGLASIMGTTGAAMLLIRPLLTANETREHQMHSVVFFILLVGNVGGALSPLGDPPLFIGFLKGVDFFWPARNLIAPTLLLAGALLAIYFVWDTVLFRRDGAPRAAGSAGPRFAVEGKFNLLLIAAVIGAVLMSGVWKSGVEFDVFGAHLLLEKVLRDGALVAMALVSLALTPKAIREHNAFHWMPIVEVAKIFAGIFVTIVPVIAMLSLGRHGALGAVASLVIDPAGTPRDAGLFWVTGVLSAFLDNAPTYLVFFNLAGGDAAALMGPLRTTLQAISMGAVYFGALTYIGNAPNFMIKAVAEDRGVAMPAFFTYVAYTSVLMLPLLALITWLFL
jgi:Na+/H+ antiporter NhaD/arsenite permease-like protein